MILKVNTQELIIKTVNRIFLYVSLCAIHVVKKSRRTLMSKISLGINIGHDQGAAIVKDGKLLGAISQERIDRIKHSASIRPPFAAIDALLRYTQIEITDIDCVGFSSTAVHIDDLQAYVRDAFKEHYSLPNINVLSVPHHQAHAESAYFTSNFSEAIVLVADGGGEMIGVEEEAESIFYCHNTKVELAEQRLQSNYFHALYRPHNYLYPFMNKRQLHEQISLGKKYEQISNLLGFGKNGAGKTMGLSAYGTNLISTKSSPVGNPLSFELEFQYIISEYHKLYEKSGESFFSFMEAHKADIAKSVQDYTESQILEIIKYIISKYKINQICLAGGVFLNCPINHKIIEKFPHVSIHICPAAGDDGQAIGSAFYSYRHIASDLTPSASALPYLGFSYTNEQIAQALRARNVPFHRYEDKELAAIIAEKIWNNEIVGFMHGRSEIGPRALCHRSILANPTKADMKDYINAKVKHRENFRPFAPVVVAEKQFTYFSLLQDSPYMLLAAQVKKEYISKLPAITHIDGSARVQAVRQKDNPFVHRILIEFERLSGFPVLLNTSFNDCGEPIVESPDDAIRTFLTTEIDILVMENYIIFKEDLAH